MSTSVGPDSTGVQDEPLWPVSRVVVSGLFGGEGFALDLDPAATILTGENGSGKSTLLRAIHALGEGHWRALVDLPLGGVSLRFADGTELSAALEDDQVRIEDDAGNRWSPEFAPPGPAYTRRVHELETIRMRVERSTTAEERTRWRRHEDLLRRRMREMADVEGFDVPDWLSHLLARIKTKHISARRLEHHLRPDEPRPGEERPVSVVERFALDLAEQMRDQLSVYAAESRRQEKVLPSQIVQAMLHANKAQPEVLAKDVDQLRGNVRELADSLARVGLFQEEDPDTQFAEYPRDDASILLAIREVYRVTLQRLERLTALRSDLGLFATFLNSRLTHKRVELDQRSGIDVVLENGDRIRPSQLSSGEQQLLALAYELLFRTERHSLVLLDEPELSLHVAWLKGLISAFLEMGRSRDLQFLIATHSPSVLAGHGDRERSLDDLAVHGSL